jgi:uncharacterized protein YjbJ (UPF0337 family)
MHHPRSAAGTELACSVVGDGDTRAIATSGSPNAIPVHEEIEVKLMKPSTKDRVKGKLREVEGALKEAVGAAAKDRDLQIRGKVEKNVGKAQGAVGRVEKAVGK